jgi:hypothetical protein
MDFPIGNIVTAIATVISVVIANKLSSTQSGRAKVWDLRRETYGVILSELASIERLCVVIEDYRNEDIHGYFASDAKTAHDTRVAEHIATVRQRFSGDYLIVSDEFVSLFEAFTTDLEAGPPDEFYPEADERFAAAVKKHRPVLLAQGRKEIAVRLGFWAHLGLLNRLSGLKARAVSVWARIREL